MTLFESRANLLPAALTLVEIPLRTVCVSEEQFYCLFAEGAVARFHWNRHREFFLVSIRHCSTTTHCSMINESRPSS